MYITFLINGVHHLKMDVKEEKLCRLCFDVAENDFEVIEEVTIEMLEVLLLKLNLDVSENPIMCQNCSSSVKKLYNFKLTCNVAEKVKFEPGEDTNVGSSSSICRFCMNPQAEDHIVPIDVLINEPMFGAIWPIIMPGLDLNVINNSSICTCCKENFECYFKFVQNCWDTEEKIVTYCRHNGTNSKGKVNLASVHRFITEDITECPDKQEVNAPAKKQTPKDRAEVKTYKCALCTFETVRKYDLKRHMLVHKDTSEVEMHKCPMCTFETKHRNSYKSHMIIHKTVLEVDMHKCPVCDFETKVKPSLKAHMLTHRDASEVEMHKCPLCTYETKQKKSMKSHMLIHKDASEVEMYKCPICDYETKRKNNLTAHRLTHQDASEVEMYKCTLCSYETKHQRCLTRHMLIHKDNSEVEMYKCTMCSYETKRKNNLKAHILTHRDGAKVQMHRCTLCTFQTRYKSSYHNHMLTHEQHYEGCNTST